MNEHNKRCFIGFKLFDGISEVLQSNKMIRVRGDRIESVGSLEKKNIPADYETVDLNGFTLMPGLIDAHIHITVPFVFKVNLNALLQMNAQLLKNFNNCIKYGVTTVRDVAAFPKKIRKWRDKIDSGKVHGPRILTSSSFITSADGVPEMAPTLNFIEAQLAGGQFVERINQPEEAARVANRLVDNGANWLKTQYSEESFLFHGRLTNLSDECFKAIRQTAVNRGVRMAMHHTEAAGFRKGVFIGVDSLEHCATEVIEQRDIESFVAQNMAIVPTLKVLGDNFDIEDMLSWLEGQGKGDFMPEPLRQSMHEVKNLTKKPYPPSDYMDKFYPDVEFFKKGYPVALKNVESIKKAGGRIGVGTDTCGTGLSFFGFYYKELEHLCRAGMSNSDVLKAATSGNADIIGYADHIGTIEHGKLADFTVVEGDPLTDIKAVRNVRFVVKGGKFIVKNGELT